MSFIKKNLSLVLILVIIIFIVLSTVYIALSPTTQKGSQQLSNFKADTQGLNRIIKIYNCSTNEIVAKYEDKNIRFEVIENKGLRIWLGSKKKKIATNMCWLIEDL